MDLVITSGGLGPTADDLTAEVVAEFAGREMELDEALEGRIAVILERLRARWRGGIDEDAMRAGNRKQAMVPAGADGARAGRHRARAWSCPGAAGGRRAPGPARRAAADVGDGAGGRAACAACSPRAGRSSSGSCACSASRSPRSPRPCARRGVRRAAGASGDHHLPAAGRDRDRDGVRPRGRRGLRGLRDGRRRGVRRAAVRPERRDDRRHRHRGAGRPDDRDGRVVHGWADGGAAHRPRRLVCIRAGRDHGVLERGEGEAGGRRSRR